MASKKKALALRKPAARKSPASKTLARKGTAAKTPRRKTAPRKVAPKTPATARRAPAQPASTRLPVLGAAIGGGFLGAVYFDDDGRRVGLITAPASSEIEAVFKTSRTADPGARSLHDGLANSEAMNDAEHPAAQHCRALRIGGKDDWQLPSRRDIYRLAENCMPGAGNVPQQTTAAAFREGGPAAFQRALYWSSTECTSGVAWVQYFYLGYQRYNVKDWSCRVRAVRKCFL